MDLARYSKEYIAGVESFVDFAYSYGDPQEEEIQCPCYTTWINHGEWDVKLNVDDDMDYSRDDIEGLLNDQFRDVAQAKGVYDGPNEDAKKFYNLVEEASEELYPGFIKRGDARVEHSSVYHKTKFMAKNLGLDYEKIDACPNDCRKFVCPCCNYGTNSRYLKHSRKMCYMDHRVFLRMDHPWRYNKRTFNGKTEFRPPPPFLKGTDVLNSLQDFENVFGKKRKRSNDGPWKNRSIFIEIPYWQHNLLRHNLDVKHIEKNIVDSILGTLLDISGKTMDHAKGQYDLKDMGIRKNFHPKDTEDSLTYYGRMVDIVELDYYGHFKVVLFKCDWYEVENDTYGLTYVYFNKRCSQEEPFVLGSQVHQCFYVEDPYDQNRHYVMKNVPRDLFNIDNGEVLLTRTDVPETIIDVPSEEFVTQQLEVKEEEFEDKSADEFEDEYENEYEDASENELEDEFEDELEDEYEEEFEDDTP
ncbi:hypothetical protein KY290_001059 [Solanum tuberosum]|uniref:Transposon protein, CACTA, En/Spm sub-class n=1 Tax=Solanum tuberosum TaxID=4113 RepID=A0ABQ7WL15_SOLTU|nr:hypothetical protein KY290_001059 [Solanum tuberosum]